MYMYILNNLTLDNVFTKKNMDTQLKQRNDLVNLTKYPNYFIMIKATD